MSTRPQMHRNGRVAGLTVLLLLAVAGSPAGCASVYHTTANRAPTTLNDRLDQRVAESIGAHDATLDSIDDILADLRETRSARTRAGRAERLGMETIEAERLAWRARKSIASIEDVVVLDADGSIADERRSSAAGVMAALEQASDEIDLALALVRSGVDQFQAGDAPESAVAAGVAEHAERARELTSRARAVHVDAKN